MRTLKKQLIVYFLLFGFTIVLTSSLFTFYISKTMQASKYLEKASSKFVERENYFLSELDKYETYLKSIAYSKIFKREISSFNVDKINEMLLERIKGEKDLFKLSFIDNDAQEISSIKKDESGKTILVKQSSLENKSNRYYIKDISDIQENSLWHSKIDLNTEQGELEKPIKPTIKIAVPIYIDDVKKGILIGNFSIHTILKNLAKTTLYDIYFIDKDGEFIWHNTQQNNFSWSKYLPNKKNIEQYYPDSYKQILKNNEFTGANFYSKKIKLINSEEIKMILEIKNLVVEQHLDQLMIMLIESLLISLLLSIPFIYFISRELDRLQEKKKRKEKSQDEYLMHQNRLAQMSKLINSTGLQKEHTSLEDTLKNVTEVSTKALNISRVSVWIYNDTKTELICLNLYSQKEDKHTLGMSLKSVDYPIYFKALEEANIIVINDALNDEITQEFVDSYLLPLGVTSMQNIPIKREGNIVGVICNENIGDIKEWTNDEIVFSKTIANSISLSMEIEDKKDINIQLERKTKEQDVLLSLFDKGDTVLFKWKNDEHWSIEHVSLSVKNLLGYTKDDFILKDITYDSCIHQDDLGKVISEVEEAALSKEVYFKHEPYRVVTRDGSIKWVLDYSIIVRDEFEDITHFIGYITDITELKQKDQQLLHQSRLAQMGEMISMIAHQWRQPLNAISLTSNNLQFKLMMDDVDNEYFKKEVALIDEYSQHLSKTIDDFRGFFKENKEKEMTSLEDIVNSTLDIIKISIENKNIKLNTGSLCKEKFETYPNEIKQVVLNIIKNAEDVLLEKEIQNPTITIETICTIDKTNPVLLIKDNAGGIPEDIADRIFDPYFSTKLEKDGTGLGLYMSKTIIEEHCGGKLSVSNDNDGAVFRMEFYTDGGGKI